MAYLNLINIKAVIYGLLVDLAVSIVFGIVISFIVGAYYADHGLNQAQVIEKLSNDNMVLVLSLLVGLLATVLGGFMSGHIAKSYQVLQGAAVGVTGIVLAIPFLSDLPIWYSMIALTLTIPASMFGGFMSKTDSP